MLGLDLSLGLMACLAHVVLTGTSPATPAGPQSDLGAVERTVALPSPKVLKWWQIPGDRLLHEDQGCSIPVALMKQVCCLLAEHEMLMGLGR